MYARKLQAIMSKPAIKTESTPALQDVRLKDPDAALGVAVRLFLRQESFARLSFGHWASTLNGQILRDHYRFVLCGNDVVGFFGWCLTDETHAERWLAGAELPFEHSKSGDCVVINGWVAEIPAVNIFILRKMREIGQGCRYCYAKRYYPGGRVRPLKLQIEPFVSLKLND